MQTLGTGLSLYLTRKLNTTDSTLYADRDIGVQAGRLYYVNDSQQEWISFTGVSASGSEFAYTGLTRGLTQVTDPAVAGTGLTWLASTQGVLVAMHDQLLDKTQDTNFVGTTTAGVVVKSLTTAQRVALTATNGSIVYDSTLGELYQYLAGAWSAVSAGSTQPNASTTVAGKVEIATQTEVDNGTDIGGTGAIVSVIPSTLDAKVMKQTSLVNSGITGEIKIWTTGTAPTNWLICDGASLLRAGTYAALFSVIGTTYGSADGTHFNIPNLKGKVVVGYDSTQTEFDALGETGGEKTVTLDTTMIPGHTHTTAWQGDAGGGGSNLIQGNASGGGSGNVTSSSTGGGTAHNNLQPYITLNYIIRI